MIQSSKLIFNNLKKYSFLLKQLINRDFKVKYKRSVLGIVWSLLYPILMMTVMSIVFSNMFRFAVEGVNYLVYLMIGIVVWNYFTDATGVSLGSIIDNFSLISKVYIPKYIFPLSKVLFSTINFLLTLIPLMGIIILSKVGLGKYPVYIGINYIYIICPKIVPFVEELWNNTTGTYKNWHNKIKWFSIFIKPNKCQKNRKEKQKWKNLPGP